MFICYMLQSCIYKILRKSACLDVFLFCVYYCIIIIFFKEFKIIFSGKENKLSYQKNKKIYSFIASVKHIFKVIIS